MLTNVDKPVSDLALGSAWFSMDEKDRWFDLMDAFAAHGGTTIDTGRIYGESEDVIGAWMDARGNREGIVVITKGGLSDEDRSRLAVETFGEQIERDVTRSLEHLRTDTIDLYFLHRDDARLPVATVVECLNAQLARGRIRAFGGSNWKPARVDEANAYAHEHGLAGFEAVSNNLSLAVPTGPFYEGLVSVDAAGRRWHAETGMPLFSWSSQARGFFTGRWRRDRSVSDGSPTGFDRRMFEVYCTDGNFERLRRAQDLGRRKGGRSAVEIALAWVLHQPLDVLPVIGPRTTEELASCAAGLEIDLTEAEVMWLALST